MRTSAAALELDFTEPSITAANAVYAELRKGDGVDRPGLLRAMETAYGSTAADGHWSLRDAYDVLELAQVLHLATLDLRSEEHTSELQSLMRISYAVFCLKKKKNKYIQTYPRIRQTTNTIHTHHITNSTTTSN